MKSKAQQVSWSSGSGDSHRATMTAEEEPVTGSAAYDESDPRWLLAQRIVASRSFARSPLLSKFLLYVCDKTLSGMTERISEQQIGVYVFGRRPQYNPAEDNIVRNYARQLRQRLETYFKEEGSGEELRLCIPRGTYVPNFVAKAPGKAAEPVRVAPDEAPAPTPPFHLPAELLKSGSWSLRAYALCALLLLAVITGALLWMAIPHVTHAESDPSHALWTQIFDAQRTILVPADDGIVMFQNLTGHSVHLADYISRSYLSIPSPYHIDQSNMQDLEAQRYTNMADLEAVLRFSRLPEAHPDRVLVRNARELHMDDLKDDNVVLLGSVYSNPWVELFQKNMNFEFSYEPKPNESYIRNRHPRPGEPEIYANDADTPSHRTYAVVALVPNLNNTGWVLLVEGLTMAGTQAAVETLFDRSAMRPILERAKEPNGSLHPFELLIETRSFGSSAPQASILTSRID